MAQIVVPGPEPDWQPATSPSYNVGRNPAAQFSLWVAAAGSLRMVAGLKPPLDVLAARLRLTLERSWEDLGEVDTAVFRIEGLNFALSQMTYGQPQTWVWLHRSHEDADAALEVLLRALGVGPGAVEFTGGPETGFHYPDGARPAAS
ncbi:hypothetical protein GCM10009760_55840 [Kitasatospora kazusensis]|uniref:Uncharacterized protein n=1 Tax=Kitasatospora kazusensis TaxID=407974 RepID=A0ABN3A8M7_9ACTN